MTKGDNLALRYLFTKQGPADGGLVFRRRRHGNGQLKWNTSLLIPPYIIQNVFLVNPAVEILAVAQPSNLEFAPFTPLLLTRWVLQDFFHFVQGVSLDHLLYLLRIHGPFYHLPIVVLNDV